MARRKRSEVAAGLAVERVDVDPVAMVEVKAEDFDALMDPEVCPAFMLKAAGAFVFLDVPGDASAANVAAMRDLLRNAGAREVKVRRGSRTGIPEQAPRAAAVVPPPVRKVVAQLIEAAHADSAVKAAAAAIVEEALAAEGL